MAVTVADKRVDQLHDALKELVRAEARCDALQRELNALRVTLDEAAEATYNATLYDPEGEREDV